MLKGIPKILSPELLKVICEMGHGDRIVIADGNFPAESMGREHIVIRMDGHGTLEIVDAILQLFPLDMLVKQPVQLMEVSKNDSVLTPIWDQYEAAIAVYDNRGKNAIGTMERYNFYEASKQAYAIIATSEKALYANIILQKGVL